MRYLSPYTSLILQVLSKIKFIGLFSLSFSSKFRLRHLLFTFCFIVLTVAGVVTSGGQTFAATKTSTLAPGEQASAFAYYKALHSCMYMGWYKNSNGLKVQDNTMSQQNAIDFDWFNPRQLAQGTNGINVGAFNDPRGSSGDGSQNCGDSEGRAWIAAAAKLWGYTSGPQLLCDLGFTRQTSGIACTSTSEGANNDFIAPSDGPARLDKLWTDTLGNKSTEIDSITKLGGAYSLYITSLQTQCRVVEGGSSYSIQTFKDGSTSPTPTPLGSADRDRGPSYSVTIYDSKQMTCEQLAQAISDPNSAVVVGYQAYLMAHGGKDDSTTTPSANCSASDCPSTEGSTSCAVPGVGWAVCPVMEFLAGMTDSVYKIIQSFLVVNPEITSSGGGSYQAWSAMRNIANVLLIIAFIIIVYSQLTGVGVSNYGIKKTLPRLVVAAILINVSFFVCQIAVDLSNILGASLKGFLTNLPVFSGPTGNWANNVLSQGNFFTDAAVQILAAQAGFTALAGVATAGYFLGIGIFIPVVIAALVAVLITFFILLARQMLIIILIVTAPVAIAAMLFPNTDKWFKFWRKAFVGMLVIYPLVALLFGGSQLAANILVQAHADDLLWSLVAAAVAIIPLFFTPALLKGSLNAIPAIGSAAQKLQAKAVGSARSNSAKGIKKLGEYTAASGKPFGRGVSGLLHGNGRMGRLRQASAQRAYEEPRMKDLMMQWTKSKNGETAIADNFDRLEEIAMKSPSSFEGQAALSLLSQKGEAVRLAGMRKRLDAEPDSKKRAGDMAAYSKAIAPSFAALKAKHPGAVQDMDKVNQNGENGWAGVKQSDLHGMKDDAIKAGLNSQSAAFESTLRTAMQDGEQERHFTREMYQHMNITPPSEVRKAAAATAGATSQATQQTPAFPPVQPLIIPNGTNGVSNTGTNSGTINIPHNQPPDPKI